ncbi:MAG: hypothetical protein JSW41_04820 [Candidatus Aenigmatarchaeota archaeon]|nr:MAG: hypothetical protein JSW41_04820 [Candidatus Aenigmarchaeota archaeon]
MIFSVKGSIQKIIDGTKTQTRRPTDRYEVGKDYAIQPGRGKKAIPEGRIKILKKWREAPGMKSTGFFWITAWDADAEGGYKPPDYERLYRKMYPDWFERFAYEFQFIPNEKGGKA